MNEKVKEIQDVNEENNIYGISYEEKKNKNKTNEIKKRGRGRPRGSVSNKNKEKLYSYNVSMPQSVKNNIDKTKKKSLNSFVNDAIEHYLNMNYLEHHLKQILKPDMFQQMYKYCYENKIQIEEFINDSVKVLLYMENNIKTETKD